MPDIAVLCDFPELDAEKFLVYFEDGGYDDVHWEVLLYNVVVQVEVFLDV